MKNLNIRNKLILSFTILIVLFVFSSLYNLSQIRQIDILNHEIVKRGNDALIITECAEMGNAAYSVFADAIINRNLENNKREWMEIKQEIKNDMHNVGQIVDTPEEKAWLAEANNIMDNFLATYDQLVTYIDVNDNVIAEEIVALDAKADEYKEAVHNNLIKIQLSLEEEITEAQNDFTYKSNTIKTVSVIIIVLIIAIAIVLVFILVNVLALPLKSATVYASKIAQGDLTQSMELDQKDETGMLIHELNTMGKKLTGIVGSILTGADSIASASQQISSSSQELSQGASEQASSVEEVSSSMEEMVSNIQQNTDNAQTTEKIAVKAAEDIKKGKQATEEAATSMKDIAEKIQIINDIAFQTNILALNAAVEAARAGEHGKGFAVVAAEVRKLAEKSKLAAHEIDELSKSGVLVSENAGKLLNDIAPEIEKTAQLVQEIASASIEQNAGAEQVNNAIQQLNNVTQQNAASSEEMATSSEELASQAQQLKDTVLFFTIDQYETKRQPLQQQKTPTGVTKQNITTHRPAPSLSKINKKNTSNANTDLDFENF